LAGKIDTLVGTLVVEETLGADVEELQTPVSAARPGSGHTGARHAGLRAAAEAAVAAVLIRGALVVATTRRRGGRRRDADVGAVIALLSSGARSCTRLALAGYTGLHAVAELGVVALGVDEALHALLGLVAAALAGAGGRTGLAGARHALLYAVAEDAVGAVGVRGARGAGVCLLVAGSRRARGRVGVAGAVCVAL